MGHCGTVAVNIAKGGEPMGRKGQKYQVNLSQRKRRCAPFHPKGRGVFMSSRREFRQKNHNRKG